MNTELIKLSEGFVLISDEEIKINDYYKHIDSSEIYKCDTIEEEKDVFFRKANYLKLIASTFHPELLKLEFNLSEEDQKEIGYFDVKKLSSKCFPLDVSAGIDGAIINGYLRGGFEEGFQKAQQLLSDRRFNLEDMRKCYEGVLQNVGTYIKQSDLPTSEQFIQSISKTSWPVEIQIESDKVIVNKIIR